MSLCGAGGPSRQLRHTNTGMARLVPPGRATSCRAGEGPRGLRLHVGAEGPTPARTLAPGSDSSHGRRSAPRGPGNESLQKLTTYGSAPSGASSVAFFLRISTNWDFYLPCFHAFSSSSHLGGRKRLFKQEKNAMPNPRSSSTMFGTKRILNDTIFLRKSSFWNKPFSWKTMQKQMFGYSTNELFHLSGTQCRAWLAARV